MTPAQFEDAILYLFNTYWNADQKETSIIYYPNQKFTKPDPASGKSFIEISIEHTAGSQEALGAIGGRVFRKYGIIGFGIWVARDSGTSELNRICEVIERIYMDHVLQGVMFTHPRLRRLGDGSDGWYVQGLFINFSYDNIK